MTMRGFVRTALKVWPSVVMVVVVSVGGLVAARRFVPQHDLAQAADAIGNYLQTVGGFYAVLLAFVVNMVWTQYNDARGLVDREATALVDLHRTASGLTKEAREEIQDGLERYVDAVLADEWQAMAARDEGTIERVGANLDRVWLAIHRTRPRGDCQQAVYGEILTRFNNLTDIRTERLSAARARVPAAMRILLYTGAILTIGSMYLMPIDAAWLHVTVTAALAGAIGHILFLIADLDDAFSEERDTDREPFARARRAFARDAHLVDAID